MKFRILGLFAALLFLHGCDLGSSPTGGGTEGNGLSGILVDGRGTPIANAKVRVYPDIVVLAKRSAALVAKADSTTTNADGSFKFANLPDGRYNLEASITRHDTVFSVFIRSIDFVKKLDLGLDTLRASGSVKLKILDSAGTPVIGATCSIPGSSWKATSSSSGECTITGVAPGNYPVTVVVNGTTTKTDIVAVSTGQTTDAGSVNLLASGGGVRIPADWKQVSARGYLFSVPPETQLESEDSTSGVGGMWSASYATSTLLLYINAGGGVDLENPYLNPDYTYTVLPVDSTIQKVLVTYRTGDSMYTTNLDYPYRAGMKIERPHDPLMERPAPILVFEAYAETREDQEIAVRVFKSVKKWNGPGPIPVAAPTKPLLSTPAHGEDSIQVSNAVLTWNAAAGTVSSYRIQISTDSLFAASAMWGDTLLPAGATSWKVPFVASIQGGGRSLSENTTYYWRVAARNNGGESFSILRRFTTTPYTPSARLLRSPANEATDVSVSPTLSWGVVLDGDFWKYFRVQVSEDSLFATMTVNDSLTNPVFNGDHNRVVGPLKHNTRYYWRVLATGSTSAATSYSLVRSFTTAASSGEAPIVPQIGLPLANSNTVADSQYFNWTSWNRGASTAYYQFQLSTDSLFLNPEVNDSVAPSNAETGMTALRYPVKSNTQYYWRVFGVGAGGATASEVRRFSTYSAPVAVPLLAPRGDTGVALTTELSWGVYYQPLNIESYRIQVSTDSLFSTLVIDEARAANPVPRTTNAGNGWAVGPLATATRYFWRVISEGKGGQATASETASFTTRTSAP